MISAGQLARRFETASRVLEQGFSASIIIAGQTIVCAAGAWHNAPRPDERTGELLEVRTCGVRVRKDALAAAGVTLTPGTTNATLDGAECKVAAINAGRSEDSFYITLEAGAPAAAQT